MHKNVSCGKSIKRRMFCIIKPIGSPQVQQRIQNTWQQLKSKKKTTQCGRNCLHCASRFVASLSLLGKPFKFWCFNMLGQPHKFSNFSFLSLIRSVQTLLGYLVTLLPMCFELILVISFDALSKFRCFDMPDKTAWPSFDFCTYLTSPYALYRELKRASYRLDLLSDARTIDLLRSQFSIRNHLKIIITFDRNRCWHGLPSGTIIENDQWDEFFHVDPRASSLGSRLSSMRNLACAYFFPRAKIRSR